MQPREPETDLAADVLLMLSSFALRTQFLDKAIFYGRIGVELYPEDVRLREAYAYALLLDGKTNEAADALREQTLNSRNIAFLRMKLLMQDEKPPGECRNAISTYLRWSKDHEQTDRTERASP
ncbi:hypothetical protein [Brucella sp. IR073]|uniref:hypothetical protein n=1 Tax=unclassified Brucella TaxID=2632610 RepID=UPI003B97DD13